MEEQALIKEARDRFETASTAESENRVAGKDDLLMKNGDQWPDDIKTERENDNRPYLTVNKLRTFSKQVIGDMRQQRLAVKVSPAGGDTTVEQADVLAGLIRQIENESKATVAYQTAGQGAVDNGFGYFRIDVDYQDESAFDKEIRIKRIRNPFSVYYDPAHEEIDGSDARYFFISKWISRELYKSTYKKDPIDFGMGAVGDNSLNLWFKERQVRVAEYWRKVPITKEIALLSDGTVVDLEDFKKIADELKAGERIVHMEFNVDGSPVLDPQSQTPRVFPGPSPDGNPETQTILNPAPTVLRTRKVNTFRVEQYLIDGEKILSGPNKWDGKYLPIVPVWGSELIIDGKRHLVSLIRDAKDPQRMYNYFRTTEVETVALQPKVPVTIGQSQIEGLEDEWLNVNDRNLPYVVYDDSKNPNPPQRMIAQQVPVGAVQQSLTANDEIKATTGIFDASLGNASREKSGIALARRDQQSNRANFEYFDNLRRAVEFCGEILVDLIPRVYDTERQIVTLSESGEENHEVINKRVFDEQSQQWVILNDLSLGKYKVKVTAGPSFATQRQETAENLVQIAGATKDPIAYMILLVKILKHMDWPGSDETAEQLEKLLPPQILEEENQQPQQQQPNPDQIKDALDIEGKKLVNEQRKQKLQQDAEANQGEIAAIVEATARATANKILGDLGLSAPDAIQG